MRHAKDRAPETAVYPPRRTERPCTALVIERGMVDAQRPPADAEAMEDERLTGEANEAGYRWAERRSLDNASRCPSYSKAFREGCAAYVNDQASSEP